MSDWKQEKARKLAGDFMQELPAYRNYAEDADTLESMFFEAMKEVEERGRRERHADELLAMVKTLQHFTGCTTEWHSEPCEQAQALIKKIEGKNSGI